MKHLLIILVLGSGLLFFLGSCEDDSATAVTEAPGSIMQQELPADINSADSTIVLTRVSYSCDSAEVVADTAIDTLSYALEGGQLYLWAKGTCGAVALNGVSTDVVGLWSTTSMVPVAVPAARRSAQCTTAVTESFLAGGLPADVGGMIIDTIIQGFTIYADVKETSLTLSYDGAFCVGRVVSMVLESLTTIPFNGINIPFPGTLSSSSCESAIITQNTTGDSLIFTSTTTGGSVIQDITYNGASCTDTLLLGLPGTLPSCPPDTVPAAESFLQGLMQCPAITSFIMSGMFQLP